jgi:hypothetical protein
LVAWARVAVSPSSNSTVAPSASVRTPSRATSASLSRGRNGGDGIGALVSPLTRCPGAARCPSIDPQSAALSTASDRPPGASCPLNGPVKTVISGMPLALVGHAPTSLRQIGPAARPTRWRRLLTLTAA